jgi:glucosamine-6-phosphate deaminase
MSELSEVPEQAISMGIGTMLKARSIILLASGASKRDALKAALSGPVTESVPASVLQTHPDVIVIMDDAASLD